MAVPFRRGAHVKPPTVVTQLAVKRRRPADGAHEAARHDVRVFGAVAVGDQRRAGAARFLARLIHVPGGIVLIGINNFA